MIGGSVPMAASGTSMIDHVYRCPHTGQALRLSDGHAATDDGSAQFPIVEKCLMLTDPAREVITNEETQRVDTVLEEARRCGWREAVDKVYGVGTSGHRYITEEQRCGFIDLLPISSKSVVLEVGCSMGQHTSALARQCGSVFALDIIPQQAVFTALKAHQEGLQNVYVACGGDHGLLPYQSGVFDVVVMNLVLEWCASRSQEPHEQVQRRCLAECARVLKHGGAVFISTKNRYDLRLICGGRDAHTHHLMWGSALPRPLMRWWIARKKLSRQPGWLHSHGGLVRLVRGAGFSSVRSFWAAPEMRYPQWFVPTDAASVRSARRERGKGLYHGRLARLIMPRMPARAVKHFTPGLTVVGIK